MKNMDPSRLETISEKITPKKTGLRSSLYVHVDHVGGVFYAVRYSEKGRDGNTLDNVLTALGDTATDIIRNLPRPDKGAP